MKTVVSAGDTDFGASADAGNNYIGLAHAGKFLKGFADDVWICNLKGEVANGGRFFFLLLDEFLFFLCDLFASDFFEGEHGEEDSEDAEGITNCIGDGGRGCRLAGGSSQDSFLSGAEAGGIGCSAREDPRDFAEVETKEEMARGGENGAEGYDGES